MRVILFYASGPYRICFNDKILNTIYYYIFTHKNMIFKIIIPIIGIFQVIIIARYTLKCPIHEPIHRQTCLQTWSDKPDWTVCGSVCQHVFLSACRCYWTTNLTTAGTTTNTVAICMAMSSDWTYFTCVLSSIIHHFDNKIIQYPTYPSNKLMFIVFVN